MSVTVYTTGPSCTRCRLSANLLRDAGVPFTTINIRTNPTAHRYVTEELGYTQAPVVVVTEATDDRLPHETPQSTNNQHQDGNTKHWSGFRPDQLNALARSAVDRANPASQHSLR